MRLSNKTFIIIIVVVVSLLVGSLVGFYFYTKNANKSLVAVDQSNSGRSIGYDPNSDTTDSPVVETPIPTTTKPLIVPKLRHITNQPIAGANFVTANIYATTSASKNIEPADNATAKTTTKKPAPKIIGTEERIRWIERATGNVFDTTAANMDVSRISNTTITKLQEAFFTNKGNSLILRDVFGDTDIIRTRFASLSFETPTSTEQSLKTTDLPVNITQIAVSPDKTKTLSIMASGARGILSNADGSGKVGVFDNPFKEWLVQWPNINGIILTTKPSGSVKGYAYLLNPNTKSFSRILGDIEGLTTLASPDLSKVLYSKSANGSMELFVYNTKTSASSDLFVRTLPEKCVWSTNIKEKNIVYCGIPQDMIFSTYPDIWYQGLITFSDSVWSINTDTGEQHRIVYPPEEIGSIIDITNPYINPGGRYLIFQNKTDLSLWGLQLKETPKPVLPTATSTKTTKTE